MYHTLDSIVNALRNNAGGEVGNGEEEYNNVRSTAETTPCPMVLRVLAVHVLCALRDSTERVRAPCDVRLFSAAEPPAENAPDVSALCVLLRCLSHGNLTVLADFLEDDALRQSRQKALTPSCSGLSNARAIRTLATSIVHEEGRGRSR
eukprot:8236619-Pyramimonas_sp.AAC.1